jgi:hypothetical protein
MPDATMTVALRMQNSIAAGEALEWPCLREQLDEEHARAASAEERLSLLATFATLTDLVERIDITPDMAATFKAERRQWYYRLLMRESRLGGQPREQALDAITAREVRAGRMAFDDPLRHAAVLAVIQLGPRPTIDAHGPSPGTGASPAARAALQRPGWWAAWTWFAALSRRSGALARTRMIRP